MASSSATKGKAATRKSTPRKSARAVRSARAIEPIPQTVLSKEVRTPGKHSFGPIQFIGQFMKCTVAADLTDILASVKDVLVIEMELSLDNGATWGAFGACTSNGGFDGLGGKVPVSTTTGYTIELFNEPNPTIRGSLTVNGVAISTGVEVSVK